MILGEDKMNNEQKIALANLILETGLNKVSIDDAVLSLHSQGTISESEIRSLYPYCMEYEHEEGTEDCDSQTWVYLILM